MQSRSSVSRLCLLGISISLASISQAQITNGLVNWSTFDDGTGTDSSVQGTHGTVNGATLVSGLASGALSFDGIDDFVAYGNPAALNMTSAMTIAAWYKPVSFYGNGSNPIVDKGFNSHANPYYQYHLAVSGDSYFALPGRFEFSASVNGSWTTAANSNTYVPNQWVHVLGVYDGSLFCLFVNGVVAQIVMASGPLSTYASDMYVARFSNLSGSGTFTPGTIDELRVYNRPLTMQEIETLYLYPKGKRERVYGNVVLDDFTAQPAGTSCHFDLIQNGAVIESHDVILGGNGNYTFATSLTGDFVVSCKASHWLSQLSSSVNIQPTGVEVNFTQVNGDVDGDNEIGLVDFGYLSASYGLAYGDIGFIESADLDGDGEVNLLDFGTLSSNFGQAGE